MSWLESYIIWNIDSIKLLFEVIAGVTIAAIMLAICIYLYAISAELPLTPESEAERLIYKRFSKKMFIICIFPFILSFLSAILIPTSDTLIKIIITKKGIDVVQSETAKNYFGEIDKTVSNTLKLLNQEVEKNLEKKKLN